MNSKIIALPFLLASGLALASDKSGIPENVQSYIIGGVVVEKSDTPWQVELLIEMVDSSDSKYYYQCGGSIIDDTWVITAAHCLTSDSGKTFNSVSVIHEESGSEVVTKTSNVFYPTDYDPSDTVSSYDIALIKVGTAFSSDSIVKVATSSQIDSMRTQIDNRWVQGGEMSPTFLTTGFGRTEDGSGSDDLKGVFLAGVPEEKCEQNYVEGLICTTTADPDLNQNTCRGDSGGPLVYQDPSTISNSDYGVVLVGITSFGSSSCQNNLYSGFSSANYHNAWINEVIAAEDSAPWFNIETDTSTSTFDVDPFENADRDLDDMYPVNKKSGGSLGIVSLLALAGLFIQRKVRK